MLLDLCSLPSSVFYQYTDSSNVDEPVIRILVSHAFLSILSLRCIVKTRLQPFYLRNANIWIAKQSRSALGRVAISAQIKPRLNANRVRRFKNDFTFQYDEF